ncbi:hypothetical protein C8D96_2617 [Kushneria marisflavi]|nr:hypothetical protein C8D96_2617 [Kushneria marisflavi]
MTGKTGFKRYRLKCPTMVDDVSMNRAPYNQALD